jgi:hypothetical protein
LPSTIARDYIINILEVVVDQCIVKLLRDMRRAQLRMTQLEPFITDTPNQARSVDNKSAIDIRIRAQQRAHIGMCVKHLGPATENVPDSTVRSQP